MSEQEESVEENINVEGAVSFFKALYEYFRQNPKTVATILHIISGNLIDTIVLDGQLRKELGFAAGQLRVVSDLIWNYDDDETIQHLISHSPNLEQLMAAITELAEAYNRLRSDTNTTPGGIEDLIKNAAATLYSIIAYAITDTGSDP
jgi:hypothetical protein